jgi:ribosomal protein L7/L12
MAERWLQPSEELKVRRALADGRLIEAIKHYRAATGAGLKEAKDACEAMAAERWVDPEPAGGDEAAAAAPVAAGPAGAEGGGAGALAWDDRKRVSELLFAGQKIQAIKAYRERTGVGLKQAKDAVEALEDELRATNALRFTQPKGGCLGMVMLAGGALAVLAILVV